MSIAIKSRMLRAIAHRPCAITVFTEGSEILSVAPRHVQRYVVEMESEGLIVTNGGLLHPTARGLEEAGREPVKAEPRVWCSASQTGTYTGPKFQVRAGGENHLRHQSRGTSA